MKDAEQLQSVVYFLTDHLCSAIDVGEDIYNLRFASNSMSSDLSSEDILDRLDEFHQFLDEIRTNEFLMLSKINQARHWCIHMRYLDVEFRPVVDLFNTATKAVSSIETILGVDEQGVFEGESVPQTLLDSRNLVIEKSDGDSVPAKISVDENFLIGGKVLLTDLLDACNTFLDSLDIRFDVTEEVDEDAAPAMVEPEAEVEVLELKAGG